ncbi:MAG: invasion associated locus B family protein [Dinoroseobacter sp.]|nr:invasion associated locus B family protein [Dinoroseobacter sp.]MDJ0994716.1 invasion associated locus B family protein [Dinoroseobacter sp.]
MNRFVAGICAVALGATVSAAWAQESSDNRVAAKTDWSVFVEDDPTECWSVSSPKETVNTRDGRPVAVNRGDILMFVAYRPGSNVAAEVSFTGGYEFREGSTVTLEISGSSFEMFTDNNWAWPASPADDAKIITAMKRGAQAVVTGVSERSGTTTRDTFSLLGFTAALEEAEARCTS